LPTFADKGSATYTIINKFGNSAFQKHLVLSNAEGNIPGATDTFLEFEHIQYFVLVASHTTHTGWQMVTEYDSVDDVAGTLFATEATESNGDILTAISQQQRHGRL
jgi:hypothetical protein